MGSSKTDCVSQGQSDVIVDARRADWVVRSTISKDRTGVEHLQMHFNVRGSSLTWRMLNMLRILQVEGPLNKGVVRLHMTKRLGQKEFEYRYLMVDVAGKVYPTLDIRNLILTTHQDNLVSTSRTQMLRQASRRKPIENSSA